MGITDQKLVLGVPACIQRRAGEGELVFALNHCSAIYDRPLEFEVIFNRQILFVLLPHVVRW